MFCVSSFTYISIPFLLFFIQYLLIYFFYTLKNI